MVAVVGSAQVAVVGAGAAGLVTSRHLLRCGLRPSIFESTGTLGGQWNSASHRMWESLTTNLSKKTCSFSDFPWPDSTSTSAFASRSEMQEYLESYAAHHVEADCFRMGCTVTNIQRTHDQRYHVEWTSADNDDPNLVQTQSQDFDAVVVATGFFSTPSLPFENAIHSSQYQSPHAFANQTVAVCGASFSALEIAADVAKQASRVVTILPRIPWVLPRHVPNPAGTGFLPLDLVLYRRSRDAPQTPPDVFMDAQACKDRHDTLKHIVGTRKQSAIGIPDPHQMPHVAISDDFLNLVIGDTIQVHRGRLVRADADGTLELDTGELLSGIDRVISCTGYQTDIQFIHPDILNTLEYDQTDSFAPMTLCYDAFHPDLPGLGFVGMYKGPYLGVMELQARLLAGIFSGQVKPSKQAIEQALEDSQTIRKQQPRAQFPRYDYAGMMDSLAEQLDLVPPKPFGASGIPVVPAFYQPSLQISQTAMEQLKQQEEAAANGSKIASIVMSALVGKWSFQRTMSHFSDTNSVVRQDRVTGTVAFSLQGPQLDTVLYREDGIFHLPSGDLEVFREYEYLHNQADDTLEIYFVEGGKRAHLFLSLKFQKKESGRFWEATSDHLCVKDLYTGTFKIAMDGIAASEISMTYRVNGPNKNYEAVTELKPV